MKVFVDAFGGDHAPDAVISGVIAAQKDPNVKAEIVLVGNKEKLKPYLSRFKNKIPEIVDCTEVIEMDESPITAIKTKKDSSIVRGLKAHSETPHSAFFSAGHSGACFAAALMTLGRIKGVERPAIAAVIPSQKGYFILLDAGANTECRPSHLADFARMGHTYAQVYLGIEKPVVGILSNGEEDSKGIELTRESNQLLKQETTLNYQGYIEGKALFKGKYHVVVTDGFTGNVVLKSLEGLGKAFSTLLKEEIKSHFWSKFGAVFMLPALNGLKKRLDYAEVGAGPLLGVDGNCFIGHGSSNAKAIKNGIIRAQEAIELGLHEKLSSQFKAIKDAAKAASSQNAETGNQP